MSTDELSEDGAVPDGEHVAAAGVREVLEALAVADRRGLVITAWFALLLESGAFPGGGR